MHVRLLARFIYQSVGGLVAIRVPLAAATGAGPVVVGWCTMLLLDRLAGTPGPPVILLAGTIALAGAAAGFVPHIGQYIDGETGRRLKRRLLDDLFAAINRRRGMLALESPSMRDQIHVAQQAAQTVPHQLLTSVQAIIQSGLTASGFVLALLTVSPLLTALVIASAVPVLVAQIALARIRSTMIVRTAPSLRRQIFYALLLTDLRAAKEVRLFRTDSFLRKRMDQELAHAQAVERAVDRTTVAVDTGLSLLAAAISGAALIVGISRITSGEAQLGSLALLCAATVGVQAALASMIGQVASAHGALRIFDSYVHVLAADTDLPQAAHPTGLTGLKRGIDLHDVWFRYGPDQPWILRGLNLSVAANQSTALVGLNAAGKSTIVKLICRLYDPDRGCITWDGTDIRDLSTDELRRRISAVFQDSMNYDLTATENIALAEPDEMLDREVRRAARLAGIDHALAALPSGYATMLSRSFAGGDTAAGKPGVILSGGQWQRVALARALLRDHADLLILDEPSAGLDPEAEHELQECLNRLRVGRTCLLISHRLSAVRGADRIVVVRDGRVLDEGTHDELMRSAGPYAALFRRQAAGYHQPVEAVGGP